MYQALLTRRYLTSKVMPLLAALAVMLCVAMVLVVWSVMGGFLATLLSSGRTLMGDVLISNPVIGFPYYEELLADLRKDKRVAGAAAALEAPGLLKLPDESTFLVQVVGIDGPAYDTATGYADSIWWKPLDAPLARDTGWNDDRLWNPPPTITRSEPRLESPEMRERWKRKMGEMLRDAEDLTAHGVSPRPDEPADKKFGGPPAMVMGIEVGQMNERRAGGYYVAYPPRAGNFSATLSVIPLTKRGTIVSVQARKFPVVNNAQTGLYEADSRWVYVRLDALQEMLGMNDAARVDASASGGGGFGIHLDEHGKEVFSEPAVVGTDPSRVTSVLVRGAPGTEPPQLKAICEEAYTAFAAKHPEVPGAARIRILTWDERPGIRQFVSAVKNETSLVLSLFGFISLTAVFLVFAIFWSMVSEKTKDVGILRAIGASRAGVAWLFLRYGLSIGVVGALLGGALALVVVRNINEIHEWLGRTFKIVIWTPGAYQFSQIPSKLDPAHAALVMALGVMFAVIGALAPAIKASRLNPVEALRFE